MEKAVVARQALELRGRLAAYEPPRRLFLVLALVVTVAAVFKGLAATVHPYALSQYLYTYEDGFLIRALPGQLVHFACGRDAGCVKSVVDIVSLGSIVAFVALVFFVVVRHTDGAPAALLALAVVGSGPLFVCIGATRGYHDALTLALGLGSYHFLFRRRFALALVVFVVALLVHELVAVYLLPPMALLVLTRHTVGCDRLRAAGVVACAVAATFGVVHAGRANRAQRTLLAQETRRTENTLGDGWRNYRSASTAAATHRTDDLHTDYVVRFGALESARYLQSVALMLLVVAALLVVKRRWLELPLAGALVLAPLAIVLVAWDVDRLFSLGSLTALLVTTELLRREGVRRAPLLATLLALVPIVTGLGLRYPVVSRYARHRTVLGNVLGTNRSGHGHRHHVHHRR